jgi:hypothetical protein
MECVSTYTTSVAFSSPVGHNHDDNCVTRTYRCDQGHTLLANIRNKCHACDWVGRDCCFCHEGKKLEIRPERMPDAIEVPSGAIK